MAVADIERLTGADFFSGMSDNEESALESSDGRAIWQAILATTRPGSDGRRERSDRRRNRGR